MCSAVHPLRRNLSKTNMILTEALRMIEPCDACGRADFDTAKLVRLLKDAAMLTAVPHDTRRDGPRDDRTIEQRDADALDQAAIARGELPLGKLPTVTKPARELVAA